MKLSLSDHVYTCTHSLHSDEVVSLLISGCEIVVYSCSPMAVIFYVLLLIIIILFISYIIVQQDVVSKKTPKVQNMV